MRPSRRWSARSLRTQYGQSALLTFAAIKPFRTRFVANHGNDAA